MWKLLIVLGIMVLVAVSIAMFSLKRELPVDSMVKLALDTGIVPYYQKIGHPLPVFEWDIEKGRFWWNDEPVYIRVYGAKEEKSRMKIIAEFSEAAKTRTISTIHLTFFDRPHSTDEVTVPQLLDTKMIHSNLSQVKGGMNRRDR